MSQQFSNLSTEYRTKMTVIVMQHNDSLLTVAAIALVMGGGGIMFHCYRDSDLIWQAQERLSHMVGFSQRPSLLVPLMTLVSPHPNFISKASKQLNSFKTFHSPGSEPPRASTMTTGARKEKKSLWTGRNLEQNTPPFSSISSSPPLPSSFLIYRDAQFSYRLPVHLWL